MDKISVRVMDERQSYTACFLSSSLKRGYVDEKGFYLWTRRSYGRSGVSERADRNIGSQRGRHATVNAAIAEWAAILYYELHFGNVNVEIFQILVVSFEVIFGIAQMVEINSFLFLTYAPKLKSYRVIRCYKSRG